MTSTCSKPILLVEDEGDVREALRDLLEDYGYAIVEAANGRRALEMLEGQGVDPCLVIVDLLMPVMDGFQFLREVAARPALSALPMVVSTSAPERAPRNYPVIPKPIDVRALVNVVQKFCGG